MKRYVWKNIKRESRKLLWRSNRNWNWLVALLRGR